MSSTTVRSGVWPLLANLVALTKPRVSGMVMASAAVGLVSAPGHMPASRSLSALFMIALLVGAANTLNCWMERHSDGLMARTRGRPLPSGRIEPGLALGFGLALAGFSLPALAFGLNPMTGLVGLFALVSYVWVYTPMKVVSPSALLVGAVPGALPPLMGWTAVTGRLDAGGLVLFAIMFVWQLPHVIGLSSYRMLEYANASIRVLPAVRGEWVAKWHAAVWAGVLIPVSALLWPLGVAGPIYFGAALVLGFAYLAAALWGFRSAPAARWGRRLFLASLLYLPLLFTALLLDQVG
jgi:protoheme IX farnesyltransferase